ncbi:MAG: hypothetical protein RR957_07310, partial [Oscillospiraceae bacterium]
MRYHKSISIILTALLMCSPLSGFAEPLATPEATPVKTENIPVTTKAPISTEAPTATPVTTEVPTPVTELPSLVPTPAPTFKPIDDVELAQQEPKSDLPKVTVGNYDISDSIEIYDKFDYSDPQYVQDKVLFGEWNSETQSWVVQDNPIYVRNRVTTEAKTLDKPLLDYSQNEELMKIGEAVKECNGNYSKPKALLLRYYQTKFAGMNKDISTDGSKKGTVKANALAYNFATQYLTPLDMFDVTNDQKTYEFDVTNEIAPLISGSGAKQYAFVISALQLD